MSPSEFDDLTPFELDMLIEHKYEKLAWEREQAAFAGFASGRASRSSDLDDFSSFYNAPKRKEPPTPKKDTLKEHIDMLREAGEGGPPPA